MTTKELLALVGKAEPGKLSWGWNGDTCAVWGFAIVLGSMETTERTKAKREANAALIVAAVNALPALCAEVEASKADAERYRWMVSVMNQRLNPAMSDVLAAFHKNDKAALDAAIDAAKEPK